MKKLIPLIIILFLLIAIKNIASSIIELSGNAKITSNLDKQLEESKRENEFLQQKLNSVKGNSFVEEEAREKLGMVKAGERVVIGAEPKKTSEEIVKTEIPNFKKWWNLFF